MVLGGLAVSYARGTPVHQESAARCWQDLLHLEDERLLLALLLLDVPFSLSHPVRWSNYHSPTPTQCGNYHFPTPGPCWQDLLHLEHERLLLALLLLDVPPQRLHLHCLQFRVEG